MNKIEIVKAAYNFDNPEGSSHLAESFQATDEQGGPPVDKATWVAMGQIMQGSLPDIKYEFDEVVEEGDQVRVKGRLSGTFQNDLDLSPMGMGVISATGRRVDVPDEAVFSFEGDKISRIHDPRTGPEAGIQAFLGALQG